MKNYQSITIHHNVDDDDAQQNCPTTSTTNNIHLHFIKNTVTTVDNAKSAPLPVKNINNNNEQPSYYHLQEEDHLVPPFNSPLRPSNVIVGAFNLTTTIIGGGVLSLPIVFQKCGIFVTTVAMCLSAYTTYMSLVFLCYCSRRGGGSSYGEVVRSAFGESMEEGVSWLLCIYLILSIVAYMVLARDVWSPLVREILNIDTMNGDNYVLLGIMVVLLPFLFQRSLHALRKICYIGFASIFVLCIALCRGGYDKMKHHHDEMREGEDDKSFHIEIFKIPSPQDLLFSFPIITCAFLCHFNIIAIQNALQKPTRQRMQGLIKYAIGACFILMYMFGLGGYVYGGNHTQGNILLNVPTKPGEDNDYFLFLLGRIGCGITIMIAMPLNLLPCREALLEVVDVWFHYSHHRADQEDSNPEEQGCWRLFHRLNSTEDVEDALITTEDELVEIVGNGEESQELEVNECSTIHRTELIRHDPIQRDYIFRNTLAHYGSTVLITVICYFGAVCVEGVATVWSFIGSSMAFFIAFVLPCGCFIVLESAVSVGDRHDAWIKFAWVILIFSIIGAFVCTTNTMFGRYLWLEEDTL